MKINETITLKGGHVPTKMSQEEFQSYIQEIKRGTGSHSSKKDYKRKKDWRRCY